MKNKRGLANEYLIWILIAVAVLTIIVIGLMVFKDKGVSLIDYIKDLVGSR
jgi:hypothetical protein